MILLRFTIQLSITFYSALDCLPGMGLLAINSLTAADSVIIPVESHYLSYEGLELTLDTISIIRKKLNRSLRIEGIILTKHQSRVNLCKSIKNTVTERYGSDIHIFGEPVKYSIQAAEQSAAGMSIFEYNAKSCIADNYRLITRELIENA